MADQQPAHQKEHKSFHSPENKQAGHQADHNKQNLPAGQKAAENNDDEYYSDEYYSDEEPAQPADEKKVLNEQIINQKNFIESQAQQIKDLQAQLFEQSNKKVDAGDSSKLKQQLEQQAKDLSILNKQNATLQAENNQILKENQALTTQIQSISQSTQDTSKKVSLPISPQQLQTYLNGINIQYIQGPTPEDQVIYIVQNSKQTFQNLESKTKRIAILEQEQLKKSDEIQLLQKNFVEQLNMHTQAMQQELSQKQQEIMVLKNKIMNDEQQNQQDRQNSQQAKFELESYKSKFTELEEQCIQQQDMIQILEIENLVAMGQLDAKPMDIVEDALVDAMQWVRADKKAGNYSRKFLEYKKKKRTFESGDKENQMKTVVKVEEKASPKVVEKKVREFKYLPIAPDPVIEKAVKQFKERILESGVELPLEWRRCEGQTENENLWAWFLDGRLMNLTLLRGKLMVKVGAGQVDMMEYIARYLDE